MADLNVLEAANTPFELFGEKDDADSLDEMQKHIRSVYKEFVQIAHPDVGGDHDLFIKLEAFYATAVEQLQMGTYEPGFLIGDYSLIEPALYSGDISNIFAGNRLSDNKPVNVKIPRRPTTAHHIKHEFDVINKVRAHDEDRAVFYQTPLELLKITDKEGKRLTCLVTERLTGWYSLQDVIDAYPAGIHEKDMAWMFRRLLVALGNVHDAGYIHGAVLANNVLIHPELHGLKLIDFKAARVPGTDLPFKSKDWQVFYPSRDKMEPRTDIAMAAEAMRYITRKDLPTQFNAFFKGCDTSGIPHAFQLREEFDDMLIRLYGPLKYRPFTMPNK